MARGQQRTDKKQRANKNRRTTTGKPIAKRHTSEDEKKPIVTGPAGQVKYGAVVAQKMNELERGMLYNRDAKRVTRRNQALNIARADARMRGARNVPKEGRTEKTKRAA